MEVLPSIPEPANRDGEQASTETGVKATRDSHGKQNFVVRNTFIDGLPISPGSPFGAERQAQSCPGTSLLPNASPKGGDTMELGSTILSRLAAAQAPPSPAGAASSGNSPNLTSRSPGLEGARLVAKPWGNALSESLVKAIETCTPSLPSASRTASPGMPGATTMAPGGRPPDDSLASLLAVAMDTGDDGLPETQVPATPDVMVAATPSPFQAVRDFCATPSPWQGVATIHPEMSKMDPVAMAVASAATAAQSKQQIPPPKAAASLNKHAQPTPPPPQRSPTNVPTSPGKEQVLTSPANSLNRLPRIASESGEVAEGSGSSSRAQPDATAMAQSFADLVSPESPGDEEKSQWWQPLEASPVAARSNDAAASQALASVEEAERPVESEVGDEEVFEDFVNRWGLDENCVQALRSLPVRIRTEVFEHFLASAETKNVSAKFMSWLSSRMRSVQEMQSCLETTRQERLAFYSKWKLDSKCQHLVEAQPSDVQRELLANFNPPPGTKNVDGRMTSFLNMIINKSKGRRPEEDDESQPPRKGFGRQDEAVEQFIVRWKLDRGARSALMGVHNEIKQAVMDGFNPSSGTESVSKKFIAYLRSVKPRLMSNIKHKSKWNKFPKEEQAHPSQPSQAAGGPMPNGLVTFPSPEMQMQMNQQHMQMQMQMQQDWMMRQQVQQQAQYFVYGAPPPPMHWPTV